MKATESILFVVFFSLFYTGYSQTAIEFYDSGQSKLALRDNQGAMQDFSKAIEIDPKYAEAYLSRGYCKRLLYDYIGSIADFTLAIAIDPEIAGAYYARAESKSTIFDFNGAIMDYTTAIEIDPKNMQKPITTGE